MTTAQCIFPALVLNADYRPLSCFPLSLWPWQDTINASFLNRVIVVDEYEQIVHSPNMELKLPSVISLKANVKAIARLAFTRFNAFYTMAFSTNTVGGRFIRII